MERSSQSKLSEGSQRSLNANTVVSITTDTTSTVGSSGDLQKNLHKIWLIIGISIAILAVAGLVLYPQIKEGFAGQATEIRTTDLTPVSRSQLSTLTTKVGIAGCSSSESDGDCLSRISSRVTTIIDQKDQISLNLQTANTQLANTQGLLNTAQATLTQRTQQLATKTQELVQAQGNIGTLTT